jgi:hypothetical protein
MQQSPQKTGSKDLQRAPKPVVDKERALRVWEEAESSRSSGNANFFKSLRNNRTSIIVALIAIALIFFRLQEATCVTRAFLLAPFSPNISSLSKQIQR